MRLLPENECATIVGAQAALLDDIYNGALWGALSGMLIGTTSAFYTDMAGLVPVCAYGGFVVGSLVGASVIFFHNQVYDLNSMV